eukprot:TRINITY_DN6528_c1_g1_i1.p1 TRINITY_DN6528_c1_g1~~TRINITY_DN6528_c1_g1_i1.p1  ORF type:complete len:594 (+),score=122.64 TRINITY_DN6528_c1_g1_i1:102-1784(+)
MLAQPPPGPGVQGARQSRALPGHAPHEAKAEPLVPVAQDWESNGGDEHSEQLSDLFDSDDDGARVEPLVDPPTLDGTHTVNSARRLQSPTAEPARGEAAEDRRRRGGDRPDGGTAGSPAGGGGNGDAASSRSSAGGGRGLRGRTPDRIGAYFGVGPEDTLVPRAAYDSLLARLRQLETHLGQTNRELRVEQQRAQEQEARGEQLSAALTQSKQALDEMRQEQHSVQQRLQHKDQELAARERVVDAREAQLLFRLQSLEQGGGAAQPQHVRQQQQQQQQQPEWPPEHSRRAEHTRSGFDEPREEWPQGRQPGAHAAGGFAAGSRAARQRGCSDRAAHPPPIPQHGAQRGLAAPRDDAAPGGRAEGVPARAQSTPPGGSGRAQVAEQQRPGAGPTDDAQEARGDARRRGRRGSRQHSDFGAPGEGGLVQWTVNFPGRAPLSGTGSLGYGARQGPGPLPDRRSERGEGDQRLPMLAAASPPPHATVLPPAMSSSANFTSGGRGVLPGLGFAATGSYGEHAADGSRRLPFYASHGAAGRNQGAAGPGGAGRHTSLGFIHHRGVD